VIPYCGAVGPAYDIIPLRGIGIYDTLKLIEFANFAPQGHDITGWGNAPSERQFHQQNFHAPYGQNNIINNHRNDRFPTIDFVGFPGYEKI
jgi:hypothetical protein